MNTSLPATCVAVLILVTPRPVLAAPSLIQWQGDTSPAEYENNTVLFQIQRSGETNSLASVEYVTADVTAKAGVDYVAVQGKLTFESGELLKTLSIPLIDNGRLDGSRIGEVRLSAPVNATLGPEQARQFSIVDNEIPLMVDPTFRASTRFPDGGTDLISAMAVLPDGHIVIVGPFTIVNGVERQGIARLNCDGTLDESFKGPESFKVPPHFTPLIGAVAVAPEGKVLIGPRDCDNQSSSNSNLLARLNPDGSLDTSFVPEVGADECGGLLIVRPTDGKVFVHNRLNGITVLNADGSIDRSLQRALIDHAYGATAMAVQTDGKLLLNGGDSGAVFRLNADGSLDQSFSTDVSGFATVILPQSDGRIVIAGGFDLENGFFGSRLVRLNSDGSLDPDFHPATPDGRTPVNGAVAPDGKVLISSTYFWGDIFLRRFNADGSLDPTFRPQGRPLGIQPEDGRLIVLMGNGGRILRLFENPEHLTGFTLSDDGDFTPPLRSYSIFPGAAALAGRSVAVNVYRLGDTTGSASVGFATRDGSARADSDYLAQAGQLVFRPLETVKAVEIPVIGDADSKIEKTLFLVLTNPSPGSLLGINREIELTIAPQQLLKIAPSKGAQAGVHLTLSPTVPGITYWLEGSVTMRFSEFAYYYAAPVPYYQEKTAFSNSLEFDDAADVRPNHRFYRAIRLGRLESQ